MRWVYLSPHFDDVALSCGGLVWEQVRAGQAVEVRTICAGAPGPGEPLSPFARMLHLRWKTGAQAVAVRMREDRRGVRRLGALLRFWDLPDCIYRRLGDGWLVNGEDDLWKPVHPLEQGTIDRLSAWLASDLAPEDQLVSPLTLGDHVDHRLVRAAAEQAARQSGCSLWYYPDYPYAVGPRGDVSGRTGAGWHKTMFEVTSEGLRAWQEAVACYRSQVPTFWKGRHAMNSALQAFWRSGASAFEGGAFEGGALDGAMKGGVSLWRPPAKTG